MSPRRVTRPPVERSKLKNVALFTAEDDAVPSTVPQEKITLPSSQQGAILTPEASDPALLLATVGGLQLMPENADRAVRLEALTHAVASINSNFRNLTLAQGKRSSF